MSVWEWIYNIVVEGLKYIIIGHYFFGYEFSRKKTSYLLLLYPLMIPMVEWIGIYDFSYLCKHLWKLLLLLCLFKGRALEKIKSFFVIYFLVALVDAIIIVPFSLFLAVNEAGEGILMFIGCMGLLFWGLLAWKAGKLQEVSREFWRALPFFEYLTLILVLIVLSIVTGGLQGYLYNILTISEQQYVFIFGLMAVVFFVITCILLFWTRRSREQLKELNRINIGYLELQRKYYEDSLKQYEDMRRFRHDINHHIYVLSELSDKDEIVELKDYIRKMSEHYEMIRGIHTGNFIADCIISHAIKDLQGEEFSFEIDGHFPEKIFMETMDFCVMLSNLFENAKEALEKVKGKRMLQLEVKRFEQWFYIILRNNVADKKIDFSHTSKSEKAYHGYGTQNIRQVVQEYGGSVQWLQADEIVEVRIKFEVDSDRV